MKGRRSLGAALAACIGLVTSGCETIRAGLAFERAAPGGGPVHLDLPYRTDADADPDKHRLDLFLPAAEPAGWPTLVFVHGGGWTSGDRATSILGIDPYRNIGRFYAARGYGVVVPSYRLQFDVGWREQVEDVAKAIAFARREVAKHGGDPNGIHLAGHSAGAWLAARVGFDDAALAAEGLDRDFVCGLLLVSGAGYDPEDQGTYDLGASPAYFERRFTNGGEDWAEVASVRRAVSPGAPPALVMNAGGEPPTFRRQADLLFESLSAVAPDSTRFEAPGLDHQRIVIAMSGADNPVSDATLGFLRERRCGRAGSRR